MTTPVDQYISWPIFAYRKYIVLAYMFSDMHWNCFYIIYNAENYWLFLLFIKGPIDNFIPPQQRPLITEDTKISCGAIVFILLAHKPLAILDRVK